MLRQLFSQGKEGMGERGAKVQKNAFLNDKGGKRQ